MADELFDPIDHDSDNDIGDGVDCWHCFGEGGFHDCGEDTCCCADPDEITEPCPECGGSGVLR
jgi:hypothetical protein